MLQGRPEFLAERIAVLFIPQEEMLIRGFKIQNVTHQTRKKGSWPSWPRLKAVLSSAKRSPNKLCFPLIIHIDSTNKKC